MERVELMGIDVDVELTGWGDTVVLPHARPFTCWYDPLVAALEGWRVLRYRRPPTAGATTIAADAALCIALLDRLGIERPHVAGHSYGGLVALEVAQRTDTASLALLEPATAGLVDPATAAERFGGLLALAETAGPRSAMGAFLAAVGGDDAAAWLDRHVPGGSSEAFAHAAGFFAAELPAVIANDIDAADVAAIRVPVLNVVGTASGSRFAESAAIIATWLPDATPLAIDGATHLLMAERPGPVAAVLDRFWRGISS